MHDCGFTRENHWFRYRAAAIIVENGCVLLAGNENEDYLYSVGGGVHMGETAEAAVLREVLEETGVQYEIDHLAVIHENFFNENSGTLKGLDCHEISGIVKGMLMKQLRGGTDTDPFLLEKLRRNGVDEAFIKLVGGQTE